MQAGEEIISYKFKNLFRELEHSIKLKQSIYIAKRIFESYIWIRSLVRDPNLSFEYWKETLFFEGTEHYI